MFVGNNSSARETIPSPEVIPCPKAFSHLGHTLPQPALIARDGALLVDTNVLQAMVRNSHNLPQAGNPSYERILQELERRLNLTRTQILQRERRFPEI